MDKKISKENQIKILKALILVSEINSILTGKTETNL